MSVSGPNPINVFDYTVYIVGNSLEGIIIESWFFSSIRGFFNFLKLMIGFLIELILSL